MPLLESAFRSGSLLEMNKESDLTLAFLRLAAAFSCHQSLVPLLLPLPKNFIPPQTESLEQLLNNLRDVAKIYLNAAKTDLTIAETIVSTQESVEDAIIKYKNED